MTGPLSGMKVIELAHIMAGPACGLMLADMGAEVIKVEKADGGDDSRRSLPPDIKGESAAFLMMNRNKRGIALDLKKEAGRAALLRLIDRADCLIENYRRGTMEKLGLGYENLGRRNPGLIYCEISGFGHTGPWADRGGFDLIAQGMSGLMSITGEGPGRPPVKVGAPITDITAGILAAMGCAAGYAAKLRTGRGQRVDTSLFEAGIVHTYWQSAICFATGVSPVAMGSAHPLNAPYQAFETADGWINVGAANQTNWERLIDVLGAREVNEDKRFSSNAKRMANLPALCAELETYFRRDGADAWIARLEAAGVPAGRILSIAEMHAHPQTRARNMVVESEHARAGLVKALGAPVKFGDSPAGRSRPAPMLGEHTREILSEIGYAAGEIETLIEAGAAVAS